MTNQIVSGELYEALTGQLLQLGCQLRQQNGYPFDPYQLKAHLQDALDGKLIPSEEVYRVKLGGLATTDQIFADVSVNADIRITQANFPLNPHAEENVEIKIIDPERRYSAISAEEGLRILAASNLERPTYEHALRFVEQYGKTTLGKKSDIIFLHEPWIDRESCTHYVMYFDRSPGKRKLHLESFANGFLNSCSVLAGVRPHTHK